MAISAYVCGYIAVTADTLVIPITADVPRTDPVTGASIILLIGDTITAGTTTITDDATPEDDYSFCLFGDGLNHYNAGSIGTSPAVGIIANDLTNGVNSITIEIPPDGPTGNFNQVVAVALTGIDLPLTGFGPLIDPTIRGTYQAFFQETVQPVGGGGSFCLSGISWFYNVFFGTLNIFCPPGTTDTNWDYPAGDFGIYVVQRVDTISNGGWTWADGTITDFFQAEGTDGTHFSAIAVGSKAITPGGAGPSIVGAWGSGFTQQGGFGQGFLAAGSGPVCLAPPFTGMPVFNHRHRAPFVSETV